MSGLILKFRMDGELTQSAVKNVINHSRSQPQHFLHTYDQVDIYNSSLRDKYVGRFFYISPSINQIVTRIFVDSLT